MTRESKYVWKTENHQQLLPNQRLWRTHQTTSTKQQHPTTQLDHARGTRTTTSEEMRRMPEEDDQKLGLTRYSNSSLKRQASESAADIDLDLNLSLPTTTTTTRTRQKIEETTKDEDDDPLCLSLFSSSRRIEQKIENGTRTTTACTSTATLDLTL